MKDTVRRGKCKIVMDGRGVTYICGRWKRTGTFLAWEDVGEAGFFVDKVASGLVRWEAAYPFPVAARAPVSTCEYRLYVYFFKNKLASRTRQAFIEEAKKEGNIVLLVCIGSAAAYDGLMPVIKMRRRLMKSIRKYTDKELRYIEAKL